MKTKDQITDRIKDNKERLIKFQEEINKATIPDREKKHYIAQYESHVNIEILALEWVLNEEKNK